MGMNYNVIVLILQPCFQHHRKKTTMTAFSFLLSFKCFIYLFGCIRSWLQHTESLLWYVALSLQCMDSPVATHGLQNMWASIVVVQGFNHPRACGILVPQPGMEPVSPALHVGFLTTRPPGKFRLHFINRLNSCSRYDLQEIPIDNVDLIWFTEGLYLRDEQGH